jgi:hypothetical protein
MLKLLSLVLSIAAVLLLRAGAASGDPAQGWDHRSLASHHDAVDRQEVPLAPGEKRVGRIIIGAPTASDAAVPDSLDTATQRQWVQRGSFNDGTPGASRSR